MNCCSLDDGWSGQVWLWHPGNNLNVTFQMWSVEGVKTAVGLWQHAGKTLSDWEVAIGNGWKVISNKNSNCKQVRTDACPHYQAVELQLRSRALAVISLAECDTTVRKEVKYLELILHCSLKEMTHMLLFPSQFTTKTMSLPRLLYVYMLGSNTLILQGEAEFISNRAQRRTKSVQVPKCGGVSYSLLCWQRIESKQLEKNGIINQNTLLLAVFHSTSRLYLVQIK